MKIPDGEEEAMKQSVRLIIAISFAVMIFSACGIDKVEREVINTEPGVPKGVAATQGTLEESITLTWEAAENAEYYVIYKAVDTPDSFRVINTRVLGLSFNDTPAASGRDFYYKVAAGNGNFWGPASVEVRGYALKGTPQPPSSVTASANIIDQIEIAWEPIINATGYNVYRCDIKYGTYQKINSEPLSAPSFVDTAVSPDKNYYYRIAAVNGHGEGAASVAKRGVALQKVPVWGNVNLSASDNQFGDQILVTWNAAEFAASYRVFRSASPEGEYVLIAENIADTKYHDRDSAIEDKTPYYYKVAAVSSGGSVYSGTFDTGSLDKAIPSILAPPTGVAATTNLINKVTISWSEVVGAYGYRVYRSNTSDFVSNDKIADYVAGLSYDDTSMSPLPNPAQYYYKVSTLSIGSTGIISESEKNSSAALGMAKPAVPLAPVNVASEMNYSAGTLTVSWQAGDTCTKTYDVYRSENGINGNYNLISANQSATSFTDELYGQNDGTIQAGVEYYYKIQGKNTTGVGVFSSPKLAVFTLNVPTNLAVSTEYNWDWDCTYTYTITWSTVKGATGYEVGIYHDGGWDVQAVSGGTTNSLIWQSDNHGRNDYNVKIRAKNETPANGTKYSEWSAEVN